MTTEEFEKELRKLQSWGEFTEDQINKMLEWHKRYKNGEIKLPPYKEW